MTPSPACEAFIKGFEQCRLTAYMPTPRDRPTIGFGSTGPDIVMGMHWTQEQADARFSRDLARFAGGVTAALAGAPTTQAEFDALVSFSYNVGLSALVNSTLLRKHIAGDHAAAAEQFGKWTKQAGVVLNGLVRRRAAEAAMYRDAP